jgi:hypothetical protein
MHPATEAILRFFAFEHLPPKLREISEPFADLAARVAVELEGPRPPSASASCSRPRTARSAQRSDGSS